LKQAYVPIWSTTGAQPQLGSGTLRGGYTVDDGYVRFWATLVSGAGTNPGTGAWYLTLPTPAAQPTYMDYSFTGQLVDAGGAVYPVHGLFNGPNKIQVTHASPAVGVTGTSPFVFGTNDRLCISGGYWSSWPVTAAFLGDSYTAGAKASSPEKSFPALVCAAKPWALANLARGGTGYITPVSDPATAMLGCGLPYCPSYTEMIPAAAALHPSVVVVNGGRNEVNTPNWPVGVQAFFNSLRSALPSAQIIATSVIWDDDLVPAALPGMCATVQSAVSSVGGVYVDLADPLLGHPEFIATDGVHPNDAGHAAIAAALLAGL
jgi:lysophospholipase L1-like esterase